MQHDAIRLLYAYPDVTHFSLRHSEFDDVGFGGRCLSFERWPFLPTCSYSRCCLSPLEFKSIVSVAQWCAIRWETTWINFEKKNNSFLAAFSATVDGDATDDLPRAMEKGIRVAVGAWNESVTAGPSTDVAPAKMLLTPTPIAANPLNVSFFLLVLFVVSNNKRNEMMSTVALVCCNRLCIRNELFRPLLGVRVACIICSLNLVSIAIICVVDRQLIMHKNG